MNESCSLLRALSRNLVLLFSALILHPSSAYPAAFDFEPAVGIDQRADDNYLLDDTAASSLSSTRAFAELNGRAEGRVFSGGILGRIDQQIVSGDGQAEGIDSDRYIKGSLRYKVNRFRSETSYEFKEDTTSRDIAADLTRDQDIATDTGLTIAQDIVGRAASTFAQTFEYDLSRRALLELSFESERVSHDLPYPRDAIFKRYQAIRANAIRNGEDPGPLISFDDITIDDVGSVFTPSGELSDFSELRAELGARYKFSKVITLTAGFSYSDFKSSVEPDPFAIIPFEALISDPVQRDIRRKPKRDSLSNTSKITLGYEQALSPILRFGIEGGAYFTQADDTDTLRSSDRPGEEIPADRLEPLSRSDDGWLANVTLTRDDGVLKYVGRYAVDVKASSSGDQVETTELTGSVFWKFNPRIDFSLRARAFEPRVIARVQSQPGAAPGESDSNRFFRRFISFEPRISWKYSRALTLSAAFRYRRQKARFDVVSSDSNAVLFSVRYTPLSALRDAVKRGRN